MKRSAGFTMIEAMIAMVIVVVLMAVGIPTFKKVIQNAQIRTAAENMQAGLILARNEALRRNTRVTFWMVNNLGSGCALSENGTSWVVSLESPAGKCNIAPSETTSPKMVQSRVGSDGSDSVGVAALDSNADDANCITFNGFGRVETDCTGGGKPIAKVVLTSSVESSARTLQVRVTSGGSVRMCNPAAATTDASYCGA